MNINLHKKIVINSKKTKNRSANFFFHGKLMGWTDGEKIIDFNNIKKTIKETWSVGGVNSLVDLMKGIVGPCIIEVSDNKEVYFFSSCASSGFYWMKYRHNNKKVQNYLISNDEGKFFRNALHYGCKISDGALMNAILSHQSVLRPPFEGILSKTKRVPPGFYIKYSLNKTDFRCFIIDKKKKPRKEKDLILKKKMKAINEVYKSYKKITGAKIKLAFSGGVDSTALLLNHKNILEKYNQGYYKDRGKLSEIKMAHEIAKITNTKINFVKPVVNFSVKSIRKKIKKGLSIMNGLTYMKHGFTYSPYKPNQRNKTIILTGQNSDTLFHVDTFAPSSFTTGVIRLIKLSSSLFLRFKTTEMYFRLCRIFKKKDASKLLLLKIEKSYCGLKEHEISTNTLNEKILKIINNYKKKSYMKPFTIWLQDDFYKNLEKTSFANFEKDNHLMRLARWIRTIGNFQQQFLNFSYNEKITICTPFSEGPIAFPLLSYQLDIRDVFFPKIFLHNYIKSELGFSYGSLRKKVFNDKLIFFPKQIIYFGIKFFNLKIKKFKKVKSYQSNISQIDLKNLRDILGHKKGVINRILLKHVSNNSCKKYLNYLYDCLELKIDPSTIEISKGTELCRLVNLQIMLYSKDRS